jgi:excisionase family DNA binding protein
MAQGMGQPGNGGGLGGAGAELAMGMAMAQQMMNQPGGIMGQQQTPGIQAPQSQAAPELLTPAQVAQMLNVSEADVTASLEAGDLKGRRIGSQWRITRAAVDSFLHG